MSKQPIAISANGRIYTLAKRAREDGEHEYQDPELQSAGVKVPRSIKVNGKTYHRADEGPEAPADDPKPMSPEAVLAADFGIPPGEVEKLKGYKHKEEDVSFYDVIKKALHSM